MSPEDYLAAAWAALLDTYPGSTLKTPKQAGGDDWVFTYARGTLTHQDPSVLLYQAQHLRK